jgi:hypothetical protein
VIKQPVIKLSPAVSLRNISGDNSNTQFAVLGLWAVHISSVQVPASTWERIKNWWSAAYSSENRGRSKSVRATGVETGGWGYRKNATPYCSMTCAGISSLCVWSRATGQSTFPWEVKAALAYLATHFNVASSGVATSRYYYYLYSLERAASLAGVSKIGKHDWYQEGARHLINTQNEDGSWGMSLSKQRVRKHQHVSLGESGICTAFAILFLRRATLRLLTPSGGKKPVVVTPDDPDEEEQPGCEEQK